MTISVITLPNGQSIAAQVLEETETTLKVEYPLTLILANPLALSTSLYTARFLPFASKGIVLFNKQNIVSVSAIDEPLENFYKKMVNFYKTRTKFVSISNEDQFDNSEEEEAPVDDDMQDMSNLDTDVLEAFFESKEKTKH